MKYLITLIISLLYLSISAQQVSEKDMIYLKNGSIFFGELVAYGKHEVSFKMPDNLTATFKKSEIKQIVMAGQTYNDSIQGEPQQTYEMKEYPKRGMYNITYGSFNTSSSAFNRGIISGLGIDNITGKQFNKYVGLGLGIGFHSMYPGVGENNMPVFLDFRGYLREKKVSPYYNLSAGYAFAFKNEEKGINDVKGGYVFHPALGFKIGSNENSFMVDVGIKWTRNTFYYNFWNEIREHKMTYERLVVRIGLML